MKSPVRRFSIAGFCLFLCFGFPSKSPAQDDSSRVNSNVGAILALPAGPTNDVMHKSPGIAGGLGYNFSKHHSFVGEFMWNGLDPSGGGLNSIRAAVGDNTLDGHSNLYAATGNYRFELRGSVLGAYFIGGGGWYYRTAGLSKSITSVPNTPCTTAWRWWGFNCESGIVVANQTIKDFDSHAFGGNAGVGITFKIADPSYRLYLESRYHYAPTKNVKTQVVDITVGIRY